jgi:hypothetical protein
MTTIDNHTDLAKCDRSAQRTVALKNFPETQEDRIEYGKVSVFTNTVDIVFDSQNRF